MLRNPCIYFFCVWWSFTQLNLCFIAFCAALTSSVLEWSLMARSQYFMKKSSPRKSWIVYVFISLMQANEWSILEALHSHILQSCNRSQQLSALLRQRRSFCAKARYGRCSVVARSCRQQMWSTPGKQQTLKVIRRTCLREICGLRIFFRTGARYWMKSLQMAAVMLLKNI